MEKLFKNLLPGFLISEFFSIPYSFLHGISQIPADTSCRLKLSISVSQKYRKVRKFLCAFRKLMFSKKDYSLPSFEEVKTCIEQNKHLPAVPTAKEIETNGINVGEMNMILLKKVEELTLHLIELKRENERQSRQNEQQQEEIEK